MLVTKRHGELLAATEMHDILIVVTDLCLYTFVKACVCSIYCTLVISKVTKKHDILNGLSSLQKAVLGYCVEFL